MKAQSINQSINQWKTSSLFFSLAFLLFIYLDVNGQTLTNYYTITDSLNSYYYANPGLKTGDHDYSQFLRWEEFWRDRVYGTDSSQNGSLTLYFEKINDYLSKRRDADNFTPIAASWNHLGPNGIDLQVMGLVSCVYVDTIGDTSFNTIYVGTNASGIWKTTDGGAHWVNKTDGLGVPNLGILDITGDPEDKDILYAASGGNGLARFLAPGYGIGILKTIDGGETWDTIRYSEAKKLSQVFKILVDPHNRNRIYALIDSLVYRSEDHGFTWNIIFDSLHYRGDFDIRNLRDIEMKPGDSNVLYVSSDDYNGWHQTAFAEVWKTSDATSANPAWTRLDTLFNPIVFDTVNQVYIKTTERYELSVSKNDPDALFVLSKPYEIGQIVKVWKSMDCGNSWQLMLHNSLGVGIDFQRMELLVSPTDTGIIYAGGWSMGRIENWDTSTIYIYPENYQNYHIDTRGTFFAKGSDPGQLGANDILFAGNDGGISKSSDGSMHWTNLNGEGLTNTQFWGIGGSKENPYFLTGGTQDNSMFIFDNQLNWHHNTGEDDMGADMGDVLVDPTDPDIIYVVKWNFGINGAGLIKTTDGGEHWDELSEISGLGNCKPNRPVGMNPFNSSNIFVGGHNIGISRDAGDTWDTIQVPYYVVNLDEKASAIHMPPSDTSVLFLAYESPIWKPDTSPFDTVKFLKRDTNGWVNLTPFVKINNVNCLRIYSISGIATSRNSADSIWIVFGGFNNTWTPARVLFSPDGGYSWENQSSGLPDMPVNCIVYHPGSKGGVFVGTDVGVYYRDNDLDQFIPFKNNLPNCIITDLEINDSVDLMRAATFGRGIYETDIACHYSDDPLAINRDTTWTEDITMERSILIDSLATLTIRCRVAFPTQAKIFVSPGGKLIVENGGVLTNACFYNWQGIDVWGHADLPQSPYYQGLVWMKSGSRLENARIGISTCRSDSNGRIDWSTTGGIVIADSAVFENNYKAIQFLAYRYNNVSVFNRTIFRTTRDIIDGSTWHPSDLVSLYETGGIRFKGCTFQNNTLEPGGIPDLTKGQGIYAINAQYDVDGFCTSQATPCPSGSLAPTIFQGLHYGIKNLNYDPGFMLSVKNTTFNNNYRAMYLSASDNTSITLNKFHIPNSGNFSPSGIDTCYGIYLDMSTGYQVEENVFSPVTANINSLSIGLVINNSGSEMNEIYNNQFDSLKYGIIAQDQNRSSDGSTGLILRCNDYHNNKYDKVIISSDTSQAWGIAEFQGNDLSQTGPAGNTFSPEHDTSGAWDIDNYGDNFEYYFHVETAYDPRVEPDWYSNITKRPTIWTYIDKDTACPSNLSGGGAPPDEMRQSLALETTIISQKENLLNTLVDGGNTETLNTEILSSTPPEALDLRDQLLNESPFLSDTAMQTAISKEDVLPNAMIRDILVANPQSATSDKVLDELNSRFVPMPDSMMYEILAGEEIISAKETLEAELTTHRTIRAFTLSNLIRYYRTDTINPFSCDSLIALLQTQPDLPLKYQLAFEYLSAGDTVNMDNTLSLIPYTFSLTPQQSIAHNDYSSYFNLRSMMIRNGLTIYNLDSSMLFTVSDLFENGSEPVKSYARNILIAREEINYSEPILLPDALKSSPRVEKYRTGTFIEKSYMKVFPNPARKYVIVEYSIKERYRKNCSGELTLTDIRGHQVFSRIIRKYQDQEVINTSGLSAGTYICTLKFDGSILDTEKIVIVN